MCDRVSEAAKTHVGVDIDESSLSDAIGHLHPPAPSAPNQKPSLPKVKPLQIHLITKVTKPSAILKTLSPTKATITWCDLSPQFFCIDTTLLWEFESDKI